MRKEFNRSSMGQRAHPLAVRGSFQRASSPRSARISLSQHAKILRASDQVRTKVETHHSKNQGKWVSKRYGDLLKNVGNRMRPAPLGIINDPKEAMMARAKKEVSAKRTQRLARVEKAMGNMLAGGKVRATRKMNWGLGLGD